MKLTIYKKMMLGFLVVILLMTIVNGYILWELNSVTETTKSTLTSDVQVIDQAKQLSTYRYDEDLIGQKYFVAGDSVYYSILVDRARQFDDLEKELLGNLKVDSDIALARSIRDNHNRFRSIIERHRENVVNKVVTEEKFPAGPLVEISRGLEELIRSKQISIDNSMKAVGQTTGRSFNVAIILTICTLLAAVTLALIITQTLTKPISILKRGTEQVARGSFTQIPVTTADEFALLTHAFNDMSEKLKTVNERKAEMMQRISHELRTPLQAMLSAHFLLSEQRLGPINAEQASLLTSIRESIDKLTKFSNQFLDIAKVEAGMMEYSFEQVDLVKLISPAIDEAQLIAARKAITVDLTYTEVPTIVADPEKIGQIVNNLLSNAVKYTQKGGSVIVNVSPSDIGVRIAVQDSGVGIAPEDLTRIFTKFYRAKSATKTSVKGTGVGLALVKALTEGHGGVVSVQSTSGVGSTFFVELPRVPDRSVNRGHQQIRISQGQEVDA